MKFYFKLCNWCNYKF